ncbi:MAG: IS30 family transposase [Deferribacteraceae bacterium]|nr:IS30 family transposase [Deferribacteraceae bacterium]
MAEQLGVHVKTVRREIQRGMVELKDYQLRLQRVYSAYYAQERHNENVSRRGRKPTYSKHGELIKHIRVKLRDKYSPDAIIGRLRYEGETTVCTKTVYNWLERGYIKDFEMKRKRRKVAMRKVSYKNPTAKRIDSRPKEADERQAGHWEMDLVVSGAGKAGSLLVFTERASRSELIYLLPDKKQTSVLAVFDRLERRHKGRFKEIFKTITCDNGSEFLNDIDLERSILGDGKRTAVYYAHPYSSWERGSNENANKLIRKFIKKGEDISKLPVAYIKRIEKWINNYPRRIFGYRTANEARNA